MTSLRRAKFQRSVLDSYRTVSPNGRPASKLPIPRIRADQRKSPQGPEIRLKRRDAKLLRHCNYTHNSKQWLEINNNFILNSAVNHVPRRMKFLSFRHTPRRVAGHRLRIATRLLARSRDPTWPRRDLHASSRALAPFVSAMSRLSQRPETTFAQKWAVPSPRCDRPLGSLC